MDVEPIVLDADRGEPIELLRLRRSRSGEELPIEYPTWVVKDGEDYLILWQPHGSSDGDQRPAMVLKESDWPAWKLSLRLWTRFDPPSPLEKGLIIGHLSEKEVPEEEILGAMNELLDLPRSKEWLTCYARFPELPDTVQTALHEERIDPRHVRFIQQMPDELADDFLHELGKGTIDLSVQETRKLMEALRRLGEDEINGIRTELRELVDEETDNPPRERGRELLESAQERAFPRTTERRNNFEKELDDLDLPGRINVSPPKNFEGNYLDVRIRCTRDDSIEDLAEELKRCRPLLDYV